MPSPTFRVRVGNKAYVEKDCCNDHGVDHHVNEEHVPVLVVAQVTIKTFHGLEKLYRVVTEEGEAIEIKENELVTKTEVESDDEPTQTLGDEVDSEGSVEV